MDRIEALERRVNTIAAVTLLIAIIATAAFCVAMWLATKPTSQTVPFHTHTSDGPSQPPVVGP